MTSKTHRKRRTVGRGRKRMIGRMSFQFRRGDVAMQRGRGRGSYARVAYQRDELGRLMFKDPRHV